MQRRVSLGVGERYPCESVRHARIAPGMFMPRPSVCPRVQFPEVVWLITRRTAKCGHILCQKCWDQCLKQKLECPICKKRVRANTLIHLYI